MKKISLIVIIICLFSGLAFAQERYISLAPSTTEILFALDLDKEIVGVSSFCNYPGQAKSKAKVGDFSRPSIETIISLKPDYIFCTGLEQAPVIYQLRKLGLNVYVADPSSFDELFSSISKIGKITNKTKQAEALIVKMKADIKTITSKTELIPQDKKIKVFIEIWHEPLMTAAKGSFVDELIVS
ncbi:MAG: helical backbone metal receptor, partial [Candidatus Omnitrophica bacterium]|nr:helical backbone metal receptor [Candidatus Omnitrophota bacterium]